MALKDQLQNDLNNARKSGNVLLLSVLTLLKSAIQNEAIALKKKNQGLEEEEIMAVLRREIKKRKEVAADFKKVNREQEAKKEEMEANILENYLPPSLDDENIEEIIKNKAKNLGISDQSGFGRLMGAVMKEVGSKAEGSKVKQLVEKYLNNLDDILVDGTE